MVENNPPHKQKQPWQEEFGIINRRPRTGVQHLKKLLKSAWPPEMELREDDANDRIEIVLRFPVSSLQLPNRLREICFQRGMSLNRAFQEILRGKLRTNDLRTARAQLANDGYNAFQAAWLHIIRTLYFDQFHHKANKKLRAEIEALKKVTSLRRGQPPRSEIDEANLRDRFEDLLSKAQIVHEAVIAVRDEDTGKNISSDVSDIRIRIWAKVKTHLYGTRSAHLIFSGRAFEILSREAHGAPVLLHVPEHWLPEDLAIALLADEELREFKTMRKQVRRIRRKQLTIQH
jgi:hypothetical protein